MSKTAAPGRAKRVLWAIAIAVVSALYFFQSSTLAPNQTDEGLLLQYIEEMSRGELPFYDFVDAYGLLNWVFPVAFYKAFGDRVWGVRMWMIILKVITLFGTILLVNRLTKAPDAPDAAPSVSRGGRFYTTLAGLWVMVLIGAQWQSLQTTYAFLTVMPLVLFTWYFVLCQPLENPRANVVVASLLTTAAIWTKLNTGLFLFAGGLFAYFFWVPVQFNAPRAVPSKAKKWLHTARAAGAGVYAFLFLVFLRKHNSIWFVIYLVVPLLLSLSWTVKKMAQDEDQEAPAENHTDPFRAYLLLTSALSLIILFGYYGKHFVEYARELSGILSLIHYTAPFPALGKAGTYVGLTEFYWIQLPWLLSFAFFVWLWAQIWRGARVYGSGWQTHRAQMSALHMFVTLHSYTMYARADETHIFQALVLVVPVLFVFIADLDRFLVTAAPRARLPLRLFLGGFAFLDSLTLFVFPTSQTFDIGRGDWSNEKCEHLRYRRLDSPYTREFTTALKDREWDVADDSTAAYVKGISLPGEEMLLLTANRLLYFNSDTRPLGGRYHFFFYLASVGLLDREGFEKLVPPEIMDDIIARPPRIIVSAMGWVPLAVMFPELKFLRDSRYEHTKNFAHIWVHELRIDGKPVPAPLR